MYSWLKPLIFQMDPEKAHHLVIHSLHILQKQKSLSRVIKNHWQVKNQRLHSDVFGIHFANPVGLAAGFDKHANVYPAVASLGFGFIEVGTLTPKPQSGNELPRLFRLPEDQAVINRMGFNNHGIEHAKHSFQTLSRPTVPIGINLGKNKVTPNELAHEDYIKGLRELYSHGDYFVINISSPNTQGLRDLQEAASLEKLIRSILDVRAELQQTDRYRPILVKLAPDLSDESLEETVKLIKISGIDGIIATNTTIDRTGLKNSHQSETGGLSGLPLKKRSTEFIRRIYQFTEGQLPIIGVGGIFTGKDAWEKIEAGASLIQIYTGMIYQGPSIARKINEELVQLMIKNGVDSISKVVGRKA